MEKDLRLTFDTEYPINTFKHNFPPGRFYEAFKTEGTNAYKLTKWMVGTLSDAQEELIETFKGFFITESERLKTEWMAELDIPDEVFPLSESDNLKDAFVKKYLMKGYRDWNFQVIANIYGVQCIVRSGVDYIKEKGEIPEANIAKLNPARVVVVTIFGGGDPDFALKFVHHFGSESYKKKLTDIYNKMVPFGITVYVHEALPGDAEIEVAKERFINLGGEANLWGKKETENA